VLFAGVGVHPQDLGSGLTDAELSQLDELANSPDAIVMSEIGLDYQEKSPDHSLQRSAFVEQLGIARAHGLPVLWHMRESTEDSLAILKEQHVEELGGAAHYFQGDWRAATAVMDLGCKISLAKPLLRLPELQDVAARLPLSEIVLETDSYPQPFKKNRQKWTEPRDIPLVAAKLAELKGIEIAEVERVTTANALEMFAGRSEGISSALDSTPH
jgi:TatD DNase family protein